MIKLPEHQYIYRHYKGGCYVVVGEAQHTETLEKLVIYRDCDSDHSPSKTWARPYDMFYSDQVEDPEVPGRMISRFRRVGYMKDGKPELYIRARDK
jgi:hypothetical protein